MRIELSNGLHLVAIAALLLVVLASTANAADLTVSDAWIRALPASEPSGGYFTLHNAGKKTMTLIGASSPACGSLMLHKTENAGGMAGMAGMSGMTKMEDVSKIDVPAGGTVKFSPGGYHLMCMNAAKAIQPGKAVPITLEFKDGTKLVTTFAVRNAAGK